MFKMGGLSVHLIFALIAKFMPLSTADPKMICPNESLSISRLADIDSGAAMTPFYELAMSFIDVVHLNKPLDAEHIRMIADYFTNNTRPKPTFDDIFAVVKPLIMDQIVFVLLLIFGLLFVILLPLIGLVFCCCRFFGKCGGQKYQENPSNCSCTSMSVVLILCVAVFITGAILYGLNNRRLYKELNTVPIDFANQSDHVIDFINHVSDSSACALRSGYDNGYNQLVNTLSGVGSRVQDVILNMSGLNMLRDVQASSENMTNIIADLSQDKIKLCNSSAELNSKIQEFLWDFGNSSASRGYKTLTPSASRDELAKNCPSQDFSIPVLRVDIGKNTENYIEQLGNETAKLQSSVNNTIATLPADPTGEVISQLRQFSDKAVEAVVNVQSNVNPRVDDMAKLLSNRSYEYVGLVVMAPIALIALCLIIGLFCGISTYNSNVPPFKRSCASDSGGCFLITAASLIFLFGWLLMLVTMAAFTASYLGETAVCQPIFENPNHDAFNLFPNFTLDATYGSELNFERVVQGCKKDESIFEVLKLNSSMSWNETVGRINSSISDISRNLNLTGRIKGVNFGYSMDYTATNAMESYARNLSTALEPALKIFQSNLTSPTSTLSELQNIAAFLQASKAPDASVLYHNVTVLLGWATTLDNMIKSSSQSAAAALRLSQHVRHRISHSIDALNNSALINEALANETTSLQNSISAILSTQISSISDAVGKNSTCRPLYDVYDNVGILLCRRVMYPLHGFWLSLGLCVMFLLPAAICAVKLAKYFRRMDEHYYIDAEAAEQARWSTTLEMPVRKAWT